MKRILNIFDNNFNLKILEGKFTDYRDYKLYNCRSDEAFENIAVVDPDLIIMDIDQEGTDGIELCRRIKNNKDFGNKLICFFTDKTEDFIQVICYDNGADAFVNSSINKGVFISKINALLRNFNTDAYSYIVANKNLVISKEEYIARLDGKKIKLKNKEFELLTYMASKPNRVFSRNEIMQLLWKDKFVSDNSLDVIIFSLRKNIGSDLIENIRGVGYKFNSK